MTQREREIVAEIRRNNDFGEEVLSSHICGAYKGSVEWALIELRLAMRDLWFEIRNQMNLTYQELKKLITRK